VGGVEKRQAVLEKNNTPWFEDDEHIRHVSPEVHNRIKALLREIGVVFEDDVVPTPDPVDLE
jgi:hypothetical protein